MPTNAVVFRKWQDSGEVIALFPELPADRLGWFCESYEHLGQHGGADYYGVVRLTLPAASAEYATLAAELRRIGYRVTPLKRVSYRHHERRRDSARRFHESDTR